MYVINDEVRKFITGMTDDELLEAVQEKYDHFTREAFEAAKEELRLRNIDFIDKSADFVPDEDDSQTEDTPLEEVMADKLYCPECNVRMEQGLIYVGESLFGFVVTGRAAKHCFFENINSKETFKVIEYNEKRPAYRCRKCRWVIFSN